MSVPDPVPTQQRSEPTIAPSIACDPTHLDRLDGLCGNRMDRRRIIEALIDLACEDKTLHARVVERASRQAHPELQPLFDHLTRD